MLLTPAPRVGACASPSGRARLSSKARARFPSCKSAAGARIRVGVQIPGLGLTLMCLRGGSAASAWLQG